MEINMKGGRGVLFLGYFLKFFKQFETLNARQGNLIIDSVRRGSASPVENKSMREVKPHFLAFFSFRPRKETTIRAKIFHFFTRSPRFSRALSKIFPPVDQLFSNSKTWKLSQMVFQIRWKIRLPLWFHKIFWIFVAVIPIGEICGSQQHFSAKRVATKTFQFGKTLLMQVMIGTK